MSQGGFLFPLACSSGDRFLSTNRVVELLFHRLDPMVSVFLLAFIAMELVYFALFCLFFLLFWQIGRLELFCGVTLACVSDSFELDLQRFAGDLATRLAQPCSPSTSEATTSTTCGIGSPCAERGSHSPRVAHAWRSMLHSSDRVLGVFQDDGVFDSSREVWRWRVFYTRRRPGNFLPPTASRLLLSIFFSFLYIIVSVHSLPL
jgi:hypothetical protein